MTAEADKWCGWCGEAAHPGEACSTQATKDATKGIIQREAEHKATEQAREERRLIVAYLRAISLEPTWVFGQKVEDPRQEAARDIELCRHQQWAATHKKDQP